MGLSVRVPWHLKCFPSEELGSELVTRGLKPADQHPPFVCPPVYIDPVHYIYSAPICYSEGYLSSFIVRSIVIFRFSGAHHVTQPHSWPAFSSHHLPCNCPGLFVDNWERNVNAPRWLRYAQLVSPETGKSSEHWARMREQPVLFPTDSSRTVCLQMMPKAKRLHCKTAGLCLWDLFMHYHFHLAAAGYKINVYIDTVVASTRLFWRDVGIVL